MGPAQTFPLGLGSGQTNQVGLFETGKLPSTAGNVREGGQDGHSTPGENDGGGVWGWEYGGVWVWENK